MFKSVHINSKWSMPRQPMKPLLIHTSLSPRLKTNPSMDRYTHRMRSGDETKYTQISCEQEKSFVNQGGVLTHSNVRVCICKVVLNTNTLKNASLEHDHFSLIDLPVQIDFPHCTH